MSWRLGGDVSDVSAYLERAIDDRVAARGESLGRFSSGTLAGDFAANYAEQLRVMEERITARMDVLARSPTSGTGGFCLPVRPNQLLISDSDDSGFEASHRAHALSLYRAGAEDYLGAMLHHKGYGKHRERLIGRGRVDHSVRRRLMPEDTSVEDDTGFMVGDLRVEGPAKRMGVPTRGDYEQYAMARVRELSGSLINRTGPHVKGSLGAAFAEFETRVILARYQFLHAIEHYLMDVRDPPTAYGAVWRYLCLVVSNMWLDQEISLVGFDKDIVLYGVSTAVTELTVRTSNANLARVASSSLSLDWLSDAVQLHVASLGGPSSGKAKGIGSNSGDSSASSGGAGTGDGTPARCSVCGGPSNSCGGYFKPDFKCTKNVAVACKQCALKHMDRGTRSWTCAQAKKANGAGLTPGELNNAFRVSFSDAMAGKSKLTAAQIAAIQ